MRAFLAVAGALFSASSPARAAPVEPAGPWAVDFGPAQCIAMRRYGDDHLILKAPAMGDVIQMGLLTSGNAPGQPEQLVGHLSTDTREAIKVSALVYSPKGQRRRMHMVNLSRETFAALEPAKSLQWKVGRTERDLKLSGMTTLLKVVDECVADLRKVWNVNDEDRPERMAEPPAGARAKANLVSYVSSGDYPAVALKNDQDGLVGFVLLVDEQGKVADCTVMKTSGVAALDAQSCAILQRRARFTPAQDASGRPVKDAVYGRIRWQLP